MHYKATRQQPGAQSSQTDANGRWPVVEYAILATAYGVGCSVMVSWYLGGTYAWLASSVVLMAGSVLGVRGTLSGMGEESNVEWRIVQSQVSLLVTLSVCLFCIV